MLLRATLACLLLFLTTSAASNAQDLAMDLRVAAGGAPGVVDVELFSSNPQTTSFELRVASDKGERVVTATTAQTSVSGLISGDLYVISAVGLSAAAAVTETSPEESIVAP